MYFFHFISDFCNCIAFTPNYEYVVIGFIGLLGYMILNTPWLVLSNAEPSDTTSAIGRLLLMDYLLPFEAVSLLLLGALIGATTLSRKDS